MVSACGRALGDRELADAGPAVSGAATWVSIRIERLAAVTVVEIHGLAVHEMVAGHLGRRLELGSGLAGPVDAVLSAHAHLVLDHVAVLSVRKVDWGAGCDVQSVAPRRVRVRVGVHGLTHSCAGLGRVLEHLVRVLCANVRVAAARVPGTVAVAEAVALGAAEDVLGALVVQLIPVRVDAVNPRVRLHLVLLLEHTQGRQGSRR